MRFFDTHCHLDANYGPMSVRDVIDRAASQGIERIVLPSVAPDNWQTCADIAGAYEGVYVAFGIHPQCVRDLNDREIDAALKDLPSWLTHPKAVAVGELGIDHRWDTDEGARHRQERTMLDQLDIAADLKCPPIIHCLDAHGRFAALWSAHRCRHAVHGIMHSYSGSAELVHAYSKQNLYFSYSGAVTWNGAKRVPKACVATPDELLLIETDAPYQSPHPLDGAPNRPDRVARVAEIVAELRGVEIAQLAELTWTNANRAFRLD